MDKIKVRNISIFILATLLCGWLGVYLDIIYPNQSESGTFGMGIWLVSPLFVTILLRQWGGDGWENLHIKLRLKSNSHWYIWAVLIFPLVTFIVIIIGELFGWVNLSNFRIIDFLLIVIPMFIPVFVKNFFEESVWRGYLTWEISKLVKYDFWLYLIVGLVWGLWHLPYYLFFLPESEMSMFLPVNKYFFAIHGIITMTAWSIMFVELFLLTKLIWPVILLHTMEDSFINPLITEQYISIRPGKEFLISPICGIIPIIIYIYR